MGNVTSCFYVQQSNKAKLIDLHRKTNRLVEVPVTAAEIMLEEPGYVVSPVSDFRRDLRLSAMKADESLSGGGVYLLIAISRVNGKVSESEMEFIDSACGEKKAKHRSSRVLPVVTELSGDGIDKPATSLSDSGTANYRIKQWRPALEPIYEGI